MDRIIYRSYQPKTVYVNRSSRDARVQHGRTTTSKGKN